MRVVERLRTTYERVNGAMELEVDVEMYNRSWRRTRKRMLLNGPAILYLKNFRDNWNLHVRSPNRTRQIFKYKITNNIEFYEEYMKDGKFTVKFINPSHNITVTDSIRSHMEDYFRLLQMMRFARYWTDLSPNKGLFLHYDPVMAVEWQGMIFARRGSEHRHQRAQNFPEQTTHIYLNGLGKKCVDEKILKLQNLSLLDLSHNKISCLPKELGDLQNLTEVYLSHNYLGSATNWKWLTRDTIQKNLKLLDISYNKLTHLPLEITDLRLTTLLVNRNLLKLIPLKFNCNLETLDLSNNRLSYLPMNLFSCLCLFYIDVSDNPIHTDTEIVLEESFVEENSTEDTPLPIEVPELVKLAAKCILSHRIQYTRLPSILIEYLHNIEIVKHCVLCEKACDESMNVLVSLPLKYFDRKICQIKTSKNKPIMIQNYYCSMACKRYIRNILCYKEIGDSDD